MTRMIDHDGREYIILKLKGRFKHSRMLSEILARGELLLSNTKTGALRTMKKDPLDNLWIVQASGTLIRVPMDAEAAYKRLAEELTSGHRLSYLTRRRRLPKEVWANDILVNSGKVKQDIRALIHG